VLEQGYPGDEAAGAIKNSTRKLINAGYNVKSKALAEYYSFMHLI
jgi:hypothetical protein